MEDMYKLKEMLCRELDEFARKEDVDPYDLETIHKLTDTIKNIDKIEMLEDGGYSQARGMGNRGGMRNYSRDGYSQDGSYGYEDSFGDNDGYSEARRRRDSRGRYSRDDGRDHMVNQLEMLMHQADGKDKEAIRRLIEQMRGA